MKQKNLFISFPQTMTGTITRIYQTCWFSIGEFSQTCLIWVLRYSYYCILAAKSDIIYSLSMLILTTYFLFSPPPFAFLFWLILNVSINICKHFKINSSLKWNQSKRVINVHAYKLSFIFSKDSLINAGNIF